MNRRADSCVEGVSVRLVMPRAVLFDMDGTLTRPLLDFPRIKAEMGIGSKPILEALAEMSVAEREVAAAVLLRHEREAAARSTLNEGCHGLLGWLRERGVETAVITRNSRVSVEKVIELHGLLFDVLITREDGAFKPSPEPLRRACERLGVACGEAWMVGDGQYDVEAGMAAGCPTVWVSHDHAKPFAAEPWAMVRDLPELTRMLRGCLDR